MVTYKSFAVELEEDDSVVGVCGHHHRNVETTRKCRGAKGSDWEIWGYDADGNCTCVEGNDCESLQ
jgi:hypothetical protein